MKFLEMNSVHPLKLDHILKMIFRHPTEMEKKPYYHKNDRYLGNQNHQTQTTQIMGIDTMDSTEQSPSLNILRTLI